MSYKLARIIDLTYLPKYSNIEDPICILDETNLEELRESFRFACRFKFKSYCTFPFLVPMIQSSVCPIALSLVEDFPKGTKNTVKKLIDIGDLREKARAASRFSIDWVLAPKLEDAQREVSLIRESGVFNQIDFKMILELGTRSKQDIEALLPNLDIISTYIKTNTGRDREIQLFEKLDLVKWLRSRTMTPIKISGGVKSSAEIGEYLEISGPETIFGISYSKLKEFDEFQ